jgi:hypothetical protein
MSTFTDLDSSYRIVNTFPNPANYTVEDAQVATWFREPRTVSANSSRPGSRAIEFSQAVDIKHLILPAIPASYVNASGVTVNFLTTNLQRIYLDVHTSRYNDLNLIQSIDNHASHARFVLFQERIQFDDMGSPMWVHFGSRINQIMRWSRCDPVTINIMQEQFFTIIIPDTDPITPANQTYILVEVTPSFRDGHYNNISVGLTQF